MSTEETDQPAGAPGAAGQPSEEELRAAYEAELARVTTTDIIAQTVVSLLNVGARRLGLGEAPGEQAQPRELEQVRDAIDAARALVAILERTIPQELAPLRDALSRLQMAYAREVQPGAGEEQAPPSGAAPAPSAAAAAGEQPPAGEGPGPAEASGRLWVPGR